MRTPALLLLAILTHVALFAASSPQSDVDAVFTELKSLKSMQRGESYSLPARGETVTGKSDDFLRRRTADEIAASGLSCGCGDYALVFSARMDARGYETLLVDSAQLSLISLLGNNAGHAVVAIHPRDNPAAPWWLVDSTARRIISRDWSTNAKSFVASGEHYWIGYCGPAKDYPARSHQELRKFYAATLAQVPADVLDRTLFRMVFTIDPSLRDAEGKLLNPRVTRLSQEQDRAFAKYRVNPTREVSILLTKGSNDASSDLDHTAEGWISRVGLQSACSPSFLSYLEQKVRRHEKR